MIVLCHKCSGVLADSGEAAGLSGCGCISGYVRGFEPILNREQAIAAQIRAAEWLAELYVRQGRPKQEIDVVVERWVHLMTLQETEVAA